MVYRRDMKHRSYEMSYYSSETDVKYGDSRLRRNVVWVFSRAGRRLKYVCRLSRLSAAVKHHC